MDQSCRAEEIRGTCQEGDDSNSVDMLPLTEAPPPPPPPQNLEPEVQRGKVGGGVGAAEEVAGGLVRGAAGWTCGVLHCSYSGLVELESFRQLWKEELAKNSDKVGSRDRKAALLLYRERLHYGLKFRRTEDNCACSSPQKRSKILEQTSSNLEDSSSNDQPNSEGSLEKKNISDDPIRLKTLTEEEKEQKARSLYIHGVELERAGKLYEAIQQYKRAMLLVPHIERIAVTHTSDEEASESSGSDGEDEAEDDDTVVRGPILAHITSLLGPNAPVCERKHPQESMHVSALPREIMEQILYWVVGADLDMRSLHATAAVCRGFFLLSRSEALWKKACQRVWGFDCSPYTSPSEHGSHLNELQLGQCSWRSMYLTRPKPRYNGCYISKISYFRSGECNFHDQNYQPWHLVVYYRFFRFFPGDVVLMTTTCEQPQAVVGHLAHEDPKHSQVLAGHYTLEGPLVHLSFKRCSNTKRQLNRTRRRRGQGTTDVAETTFKMTLELSNARRGCRNWFLQWRQYTISSLDFSGAVHSAQVDVTQLDSFPQLAFSRVKSYTKESSEPLK
ncbi:F-box domain [Trinorchestia longiramus]|nr:F-box domain [Trinorchestia longiramus]